MNENLSSEETAVVATYSNRHDAEVARSFLEDQGVASFITADDVHPPLQLTEGVKLRVMSKEAQSARKALADAEMLSGRMDPAELERGGEGTAGGLDLSAGSPARFTAWAYVVMFVLVVSAIAIGLLIT